MTNAAENAILDASLKPEPALQAMSQRQRSYRQILKSSLLIGGSSAINVVIGIVRTKAMAMLLGPAGYGVMGTYAAIADLSRNIAQLGVSDSGVRQIADAVATGQATRIAGTVAVLKRVSLACALLGALMLAGLSSFISKLSFGDGTYAQDIAWMGLAIFFTLLSGSQVALLQGMRRIRDMAKLAVIGGLSGTVISVAMVYLFGPAGIAAAMVVTAACTATASWWYSSRIEIQRSNYSREEILHEAGGLLKLGVAFMFSSLMTLGVAYVVRILIVRQIDLDAAGLYQAAWTLGGLYIGFILNALGTDFYPRLVGVADDNCECNRVVNEQASVSLLLALPGVLATIALAPVVVSLFYSPQFTTAVDILRWICLGMALRVMSYPLGYVLVAKNKRTLFLVIDGTWAVTSVVLAWFSLKMFGANGAGMAYFASYVIHTLIVYVAVRQVSGFRWSPMNKKVATAFLVIIAATFICTQTLPNNIAIGISLFACVLCALASLRTLVHLSAPQHLPPFISRWMDRGRRP